MLAQLQLSKRCNKCGEEKPVSEFYAKAKGKYGVAAVCKPCFQRQASEITRRRKYGLTAAECAAMLAAQDGACAICGSDLSGEFCVDHNHETGAVRGLLCTMCNRGLGHFKDSMELVLRAALYLEGGDAHARSVAA